MSKQEDKNQTQSDELQDHYDLDYSKAKPNRFASRLAKERLMVVIEPDIAAVFPTSEAVNEALRVLAAAATNLSNQKSKSTPTSRPTTVQSTVSQ